MGHKALPNSICNVDLFASKVSIYIIHKGDVLTIYRTQLLEWFLTQTEAQPASFPRTKITFDADGSNILQKRMHGRELVDRNNLKKCRANPAN